MGLFDKLFKSNSNNDIVAVCDGEVVDVKSLSDKMFAEQMMGKTFAIEPSNGEIVSPVSGKIEALFPTSHAFGVRGEDGTGYLVHIGIDTVNLNGDGFTVLKKQDDVVKAGETVVKVDLDKLKKTNPVTTMLIVTEPVAGKEYSFTATGKVSKGQKIN